MYIMNFNNNDNRCYSFKIICVNRTHIDIDTYICIYIHVARQLLQKGSFNIKKNFNLKIYREEYSLILEMVFSFRETMTEIKYLQNSRPQINL